MEIEEHLKRKENARNLAPPIPRSYLAIASVAWHGLMMAALPA